MKKRLRFWQYRVRTAFTVAPTPISYRSWLRKKHLENLERKLKKANNKVWGLIYYIRDLETADDSPVDAFMIELSGAEVEFPLSDARESLRWWQERRGTLINQIDRLTSRM